MKIKKFYKYYENFYENYEMKKNLNVCQKKSPELIQNQYSLSNIELKSKARLISEKKKRFNKKRKRSY